MTTQAKGPKVIVAQSECMLNRQRREKPLFVQAVKAGERRVRERFGVDDDLCTGDHSCIRLSGCPSLTLKANPDPLREDPIAHVDNGCVGCGVCGVGRARRRAVPELLPRRPDLQSEPLGPVLGARQPGGHRLAPGRRRAPRRRCARAAA